MALNIGTKNRGKRDLTGGTGESEIARLRGELVIDKDELDAAIIRQASLFDEASDNYTQFCSLRDEAKAALELLGDELKISILQKHRGEKITVGEVDARVGMDKRYRDAHEKLMQLARTAAAWGTLKDSFHQRRYMLQELCNLFSSGYWTKQSMKGGGAGDRAVGYVRNQLRRS